MKIRILLLLTFLTNYLIIAQTVNDEMIVGQWKAIKVLTPNKNNIPEKQAVKLIEDAFKGSIFNFKGDRIFKIKFGELGDERMKELFFIDNQNWKTENNTIKIGSKSDAFSTMHIQMKKVDGKTYFLLPMLQLEVIKIKNDKLLEIANQKVVEVEPATPKILESNISKIEYIKIDPSNLIKLDEIDTPPLSPDCKEKWNSEKQRETTKKFIRSHIIRKFNTDLAEDLKLTGIVRIELSFVIDSNGNVINIESEAPHKELEKEALRVISLLPKFKAGKQNNIEAYTLVENPITFRIAE